MRQQFNPSYNLLDCVSNKRSRTEAFEVPKKPKTSCQSLQSSGPVSERCHSIMTWVIFRLRDAGLLHVKRNNANTPRRSSKNSDPALSLSFSHSFVSATRIQPPSLADFMDVRRLTFSLAECTPVRSLPPPSLPSFLPFSLLSLPSFVRHLFTLDQPRRDS